MKFWMLWGFDALVALGFVYFFFVGVSDGTVSSFNIVLWMTILGFFGVILAVPLWLRRLGYEIAAVCVLLVVGVPALLSLLFFLLILITNPRMN
jgi:hypothetical protein